MSNIQHRTHNWGAVRTGLQAIVDHLDDLSTALDRRLWFIGRHTICGPGRTWDDCPVYADELGNAYVIHRGKLVAMFPARVQIDPDPETWSQSLGRALRLGDNVVRPVALSRYQGVQWVL